MLTLLVKGTPAEAASALIVRGIDARPLAHERQGENVFVVSNAFELHAIEWFCEEDSVLLWYSVRA